ncbi:MAG TPA: aminotransferase class III-fold pyridoxal phosphate-dependent enzyme, partial [Verrucomicrobiae bacterium]|nr:aminotransferase class III-fold pyridoxal phosphate-dependent enzyme [Verrucomicrobiae bacterium]
GQAEVIALAQALGGVSADTISYIEAHGTGTPLGDPIEIAGLTQAFRRTSQRRNFCAIGSVKTNIGHLDVAAGVAGLIKCVLALEQRQIPPSLHFTSPNPKIDFADSPFYVNDRLAEWTANGHPRRAGVSSFGVGGTNAHVVLEEAPPAEVSGPSRRWKLVTLSAKGDDGLARAAENLCAHLRASPDVDLADVAFSLQTGRRDFPCRRFVVAGDTAEAITALETPDPGCAQSRRQPRGDVPVVFMFPGQGAQHVNMGAELYQTEPIFRLEFDRCADWLRSHFQLDLRAALYPAPDDTAEAEKTLLQTGMTQPALFAVEYALAKLWLSWGVKPAAMIGHSLGEYVAGCLADVFSLEDALRVVASRAQWVQEQPPGSMLAVRLTEPDLQPFLQANASVSIAAINAPAACVVSGPFPAIEEMERQLTERRVGHRRLHTSHAFHSAMMDPVVPRLVQLLRRTRLNPPRIPYVSNVTGNWVQDSQATDPEYWAGHVRQPVRFADGVARFFHDNQEILLEVGPGQTLATLARQHPGRPSEQTILSSLTGRKEGEAYSLLRTLGGLWLGGARPGWKDYWNNERRRRVFLPPYPFERKRHWVEPAVHQTSSQTDQQSVNAEQAPASEPQRSTTTEIVMSAEPLQNTGRDQGILNGLRAMFQELSGIDLSSADPAATFLELGFDSLFLTQARQLLQSRFNVKITYRQLMEDVSSLGALAAHIDQQLPPDAAPARPAAAVGASPVSSTTGAAPAVTDADSAPDPRRAMAGATPTQPTGDAIRDAGSLAGLFQKQLETVQHLIDQQLSLLGQRNGGDAKVASAFAATAPPPSSTPVKDPAARNGEARSSSSAAGATELPSTGARAERTGFGPYQPPRKEAGSILTPAQSKWLEDFVSRYTERTARSKANAQAQRKAVADPRSIANFRLLWKELVYQIVVDRAEGARLWDIDGNEYIDVTMGFGVNLFGHSPPFIRQAAAEQLGKGVAIGPQSLLTGEVADLVRGFTGMERVTFCNTGSEAVLAAMRVARTVTGRSKIAYFSGDYHGMFDEVLCRPHASGGRLRSVPVAPGIPPSAGDDVLIFEYGAPETLDRLREHAGELAAVLVEPVQSRHPDLQPKEFLQELRRLTEQAGALLIFDEVITGFRVHPGGAQAIFGVRPDLAAYGKVAGGGFPIGILAGRAECMDVLDGGDWRYGDNSSPEADMTFFAGTFVRHPLALAAAKASLLHLKERGPALQQELNDKTASMARTLNAYFEEHNAPIQVHHFGSLFRFHFHPAWPFAPLFVFHALEKGIYFREAHQNCFLSTAHTNDDVDRIISAFKAGSRLLEEAGLAGMATHSGHPPRDTGQGASSTGKPGESEEPVTTGLTEGQREIWQACQLSPEASCAYNESFTMRFKGRIDVARMQDAIHAVVSRHEALRIRIDAAGENLSVVAPDAVKLELPFEDLSALSGDEQAKRQAVIHAEESRRPFALEKGPLIRVRLIKLADDEHALVFTANHLVCDGESSATILADLGAFYSAACRGVTHTPAAAPSFRKFAQEQAKRVGSAEDTADEKWWHGQFATPVPNLVLPADHPRPESRAARAGMARAVLSQESTQALRRAGKAIGCTLFGTLFAAFKALLHRLSGQEDVAVGTFVSVPSMSGWQGLVGHGISLLPIRSRLDPEKEPSFRDFARALQSLSLDAQEHGAYTYGRLVRQLRLPRQPGWAPLIQAVFNLDRKENEKLKFEGLTVEVSPNAHSSVVFDLFLNVRETADCLYFDLEHNAEMFEPSTVERWLRHYQTLLEAVITNPQIPVGALPLLAPSEKKAVLAASQGPALTVPSLCLHELFEAQAQRTPRAVAVTWNRENLTYRELDRRAQELADRLRSLGVGPESLVGICLERHPPMIVSMLAVLKAGGAYVPLDPQYPAERLSYIMED